MLAANNTCSPAACFQHINMLIAILGTAFAQGLLGSIHCVGMCGPFVYLFNAGAKKSFVRNFVYNASRSISYSTMGFVLGSIGFGINTFFLSNTAAILGGALIILFAFSYIIPGPFSKIMSSSLPNGFYQFLAGTIKKFDNKTLLAGFMGGISGLLPCGLLYPAYSMAILTGNPWHGALVMFAFSLGTYPALMVLGMISQKVLAIFQKVQYRIILAILLLALGIYTIVTRVNIDVEKGEDCHTEVPEEKK